MKGRYFMAYYNNGNRNGGGSWNSRSGWNSSSNKGKANVFAPYNFIPFTKSPVYIKNENDIIGHNVLADHTAEDDELYSGDINYIFEAMTPIFVDDGKEGKDGHQFCKNAEGKYMIPGSTIRGLIRNNALVLGMGNVYDEVEDYSLMYRNVANGLDKKRYGDILGAGIVQMKDAKGKNYSLSVLKNVRAGYIEKQKDGKYVIYKTVADPDNNSRFAIAEGLGEINYYTLSERTIIELYLKDEKTYERKPDSFDYSFLIPEMKNSMMNEVCHFTKEFDRTGRPSYRGRNNLSYIPYYKEVAYQADGRYIRKLKPFSSEEKLSDSFKMGTLISTGFMQRKKAIYVIPAIDDKRIAVEISDRDLRDFEVDFNRRKNSIALEKKNTNRNNKGKVEEYKSFFNLPQKPGAAGRKPVFYIEYGGRCYFGFTPRLRLFYDNNVSFGIPRNHIKGRIDYVKAIFGYTDSNDGKNKDLSRKTRVSFADAVLTNKTSVLRKRFLTLSEPRPTDCLNYLDQSSGETSYNSTGMKLRGAKQYWLHKEVDPGIKPGEQNAKLDSEINPLQEGSIFQGVIRFKNLRKYELGLLLWSVCLREESWMNLGKGKSYGYGAVKLKDCTLSLIDNSKAYGLNNAADLLSDPYVKKEKKDIEELILAYKQYMSKYNGGRDIETIPLIRDFFAMKNSERIPDSSMTCYMNLEQFQAQTRTKTALPEVQEVIAKN